MRATPSSFLQAPTFLGFQSHVFTCTARFGHRISLSAARSSSFWTFSQDKSHLGQLAGNRVWEFRLVNSDFIDLTGHPLDQFGNVILLQRLWRDFELVDAGQVLVEFNMISKTPIKSIPHCRNGWITGSVICCAYYRSSLALRYLAVWTSGYKPTYIRLHRWPSALSFHGISEAGVW